ncbi:MAG: class I SAM-dependent methyltransferase [Pseudomonadota bacterium]
MNINNVVKIEDWVRNILVDPLGKEDLIKSDDGNYLITSYGRKYPIVDGIYDLRLLNNYTTSDQKRWMMGQIEFQKYSASEASHYDYNKEKLGVEEVYAVMPIKGSCLDIGGHQGRLRAFLQPNQKYVSCDPFLGVFNNVSEKIIQAYPFITDPLNFLACDAEFLPFKSCSFDTVHMRSVIDHFLNPELAINEAYRVLNQDGQLIVGLFVIGGKDGKLAYKEIIKEKIREVLPSVGIKRYIDHHTWHPTFNELKEIILLNGFEIIDVLWQSIHCDKVCYIRAKKKDLIRTTKLI